MGFRAGTIRTDKFLTNLAQKYGASEYTWMRLFPPMTVSQETGFIKVTNKEGYFKGAPEHVTGSPTERNTRSYSNQSYVCIERGISELICDADEDRAEKPIFQLKKDAMEAASQQINLALEIRAMEVATGGGISTSSPDHQVTPSNTWDNQTSATPLDDITLAKRMISDAIGREPNVIFMSTEVEEKLARHPQIKELMKYSNATATLEKGGLPNTLLNMTRVTSNVVYNSADVGQTVSNANIWRRHCFLAYVKSGDPVNFANMIFWAPRNMRTRTWRDAELEGTVIEVYASFGPHIMTSDAAYWFENVIAA